MVNINSSVDFDTANIIGEEFGVKVKKEATNISIDDVLEGNITGQKINGELLLQVQKGKIVLKSSSGSANIHIQRGEVQIREP